MGYVYGLVKGASFGLGVLVIWLGWAVMGWFISEPRGLLVFCFGKGVEPLKRVLGDPRKEGVLAEWIQGGWLAIRKRYLRAGVVQT